MSDLIASMLAHRSIRSYLDKPVPDELIKKIVQCVQAAPTWVNMQHVSIVVVKDAARRKQMAEFCRGQQHIAKAPVFMAFCSDFYRTGLALAKHGVDIAEVMGSLDNVVVAAHEVGLAIGTATAAAESMGLGTVAIGDLRANADKVIEMLKLPKYVYPMIGLCVGYAAEDPGIKPKLPLQAVCFEEEYNPDLTKLIDEYDKTYAEYRRKRSNATDVETWTESAAAFYQPPYDHYPEEEKVLKQQGYLK